MQRFQLAASLTSARKTKKEKKGKNVDNTSKKDDPVSTVKNTTTSGRQTDEPAPQTTATQRAAKIRQKLKKVKIRQYLNITSNKSKDDNDENNDDADNKPAATPIVGPMGPILSDPERLTDADEPSKRPSVSHDFRVSDSISDRDITAQNDTC